MQTFIIIFLSCLNFISIALFFRRWYQFKTRQQDEANSFADHALKQGEIIGKAIELQNAYCNAIYEITQRVDITETEDELLREVNMRQRNFLYHLRKINPNYSIIKNEL